jgi:hypothetical protein
VLVGHVACASVWACASQRHSTEDLPRPQAGEEDLTKIPGPGQGLPDMRCRARDCGAGPGAARYERPGGGRPCAAVVAVTALLSAGSAGAGGGGLPLVTPRTPPMADRDLLDSRTYIQCQQEFEIRPSHWRAIAGFK